ncbi:MAG: hypothetical protein HRT66_02070 [Flavobacteriaceae bacterium]|nr:hypothetical protein [Flavobacteriaceae bacterium]
MKSKDILEKSENIKTDLETKKALLGKIENDMEKVITEIRSLKTELNARITNFKWTISIIGIALTILGFVLKYSL